MVDTFNRLLGATATTVAKSPVRAASTANLYLSGYQTIDGQTFGSADEAAGSNMRVLVKDQTDATQNGIYIVNSGVWTRAPDFDGNSDFVNGTSVYVSNGNSALNQGAVFIVSASDPIKVGINSITFQRVYSDRVERSAFDAMSSALVRSITSHTASQDSGAAIAAAINEVITDAASAGGVVILPPGLYPLAMTTRSLTQEGAIFLQNNVIVKGSGPGATILKLVDNANCHVVFGRDLTDAGVYDLSIDGTRSTQALNSGGAGAAPLGLGLFGTPARVHFDKLHIYDTYDYGVGVEVGSLQDSTIEDILIERTGSDGIDFKNTAINSYGNRIRNITVRTFGLQGETGEIFAGVDLAGQVMAAGIRVENIGYGMVSSGRTGIRFNIRDASSVLSGAAKSGLSDFYVAGNATYATDPVKTWGVDIMTEGARVSSGYIEKCGIGLVRSQRYCEISDIEIRDCFRGWNEDTTRTSGGSPLPTQSSKGGAANITIAGCTEVGMRLDSSTLNQSYVNFTLDGNSINQRLLAGCSNNTFIGGNYINAGTTNVADASTAGANKWINVYGYKTSNTVVSSSTVNISATAVTSISIPHGLAITPDDSKISLTLRCNSAVEDWTAFVYLRSIDATNVNCKVRVTAASATGGSTANVLLTVAA